MNIPDAVDVSEDLAGPGASGDTWEVFEQVAEFLMHKVRTLEAALPTCS